MEHKILIVDDEKIVGKAIGRVLKGQGYDVEVAFNGEEGVILAREKKFHLALVDLILPGIDGLQTCMQINEESPDTKLVLMSGYIEKLDETRKIFGSIKNSADFLEKPFGGNEIIKMANDIIRKGMALHE